MSLSIEQPDWAEILDAHTNRRLLKLHTSAPGKIVDYDESAQTATVQLVVQEEAGDADTFETIPALTDVPIAWPAGGGYAITMPLVAGDLVLVVFSAVDDTQWRATGDIAPPNNLRRHGLYAKAIPCGGLDSKTLPSHSGKLYISSQDGSGSGVVLDGTLVELAGGADFVALSAKVDAAFTSVMGYLTTHTHTVPIIGPVGTTPSTPPVAPTPPTIASSAATKVKAT